MHKITIWGAGAIGGMIGANLARAGEDVLLVDLVSSHVEAMNSKGIFIEKEGGGFTVPIKAALPGEVAPPLDIVFLAVKSQHTRDAMAVIQPLVQKDSVVVSLQNGLNEEVIAEKIGRERTLGSLVNFSVDYIAPGHILYGGEGSIILGELDGRVTQRLERLRILLNKAMPTGITENLMGYKWSKACYFSLMTATALVDEPVHEVVLRSEPIQEVLVALVCELLEVASAYGVKIVDFDEFLHEAFPRAKKGDRGSQKKAMEAVAHHYRGQTKTKTGIWRDMAVKKRKTEVDAVVGTLVKKGEIKGFSCPLNRRLIELIHEIEDGKRPMQWKNLDDLIGVHHAQIYSLR